VSCFWVERASFSLAVREFMVALSEFMLAVWSLMRLFC
jgi:hypothetical protein